MAAALRPRSDLTAADLRLCARRAGSANQARRLLALAAIYEGARRSEAAKIGGGGFENLRGWQRRGLAGIVEAGPVPAAHGVVRWRLVDLVQWIWEEFRVALSATTLSRELRTMGYRKLSARPRHHAQSEGALESFKKTSQLGWRQSPGKPGSLSTT